MKHKHADSRVELVAIVAILLAATAFRFMVLDYAPPGMTGDEAMNGMNITELLAGTHSRGRLPIFFFDNVPKEPLFIYLQALSVAVFGKSIFAMRIVAGSFGMLTLCVTYVLAKRLFGLRVALITLGFMAFSFWHVFASRVGLRSISAPFFIAMTFYFLWRGFEGSSSGETAAKNGRLNWLLSGLFAGVGLYTYPSSRFVPLIVICFVVYLSIRYLVLRGQNRQTSKAGLMAATGGMGWLLLGGTAFLVSLPLLVHWLNNPLDFTARSDSVLMFNPITGQGNLLLLLSNIVSGLGMFSFKGEVASRWGMSDRAIFDPFTSVLFYAGIVLSFRQLREPKRAFILIWLSIMLLPDILTRDSPQFSRAVGILPVVFMFPAITMDYLMAHLAKIRVGSSRLMAMVASNRSLLMAIPIVWIVLMAGFTVKDYFFGWAELLAARQVYNGDLFSMAQYMNRTEGFSTAYVSGESPQDWDRPPFDFLVREPKKAKHFDARQSLVFAADAEAGRTPILLGFSRPPATIANRFLPESSRTYVGRYSDGTPAFEVYDTKGRPGLAREFESAPMANLGGLVELVGYDVPPVIDASGRYTVILKWRVKEAASRDDYSFFVHLVDSQGTMVAQGDGNGYASADWAKGEEFITWYDLNVPLPAENQICHLDVGMYTWRDQRPTQAFDPGMVDIGTSVRLTDLKVRTGTPANAEKELNMVDATFGGQVMLTGYVWSKAEQYDSPLAATDGVRTTLSLQWKALKNMTENYTVFVHVLDENGTILVQKDGQPRGGAYPTSKWDEGEIVVDRVEIEGDLGRAKSAIIGLYDATGKRLDVVGRDGQPLGDRLVLETR